jgi:hypothetical protein
LNISRRDFVGGMTGAAATLCSYPRIGWDTLRSRREHDLNCVVLDLNSHCVLPESLQGYQAALAGEHDLFQAKVDSRWRYGIAIVPGLGVMDPSVASSLADLLEAGTSLVLESGAGFLSPPEFIWHQKVLSRYFDIAIDPPVDLWRVEPTDGSAFPCRSGRNTGKKLEGQGFVPYVNYLWPHETRVRDFSRIVHPSLGAGDVIGTVGTLPVALKRRVGKGTLIFLGSPMGPALRAGDPEARSWLRLITSRCSTR